MKFHMFINENMILPSSSFLLIPSLISWSLLSQEHHAMLCVSVLLSPKALWKKKTWAMTHEASALLEFWGYFFKYFLRERLHVKCQAVCYFFPFIKPVSESTSCFSCVELERKGGLILALCTLVSCFKKITAPNLSLSVEFYMRLMAVTLNNWYSVTHTEAHMQKLHSWNFIYCYRGDHIDKKNPRTSLKTQKPSRRRAKAICILRDYWGPLIYAGWCSGSFMSLWWPVPLSALWCNG